MDTSQIVGLLLSGGFATFLAATVQSYLNLRRGAKSREQDTLEGLAERARLAEADNRYWARIVGGYIYQLQAAGLKPDPLDPVPPSEADEPPRRRGRR